MKTFLLPKRTVNAARVKTRTLNGREHLVVPVTLLVSGVLNGSRGPLYYPPDEIFDSLDGWNGMPLLLDHPANWGLQLSGRDPAVINKYGLGSVFNATWDEGRTALRGEAWFDLDAVRKNAPPVLEHALRSGYKIEVSTGLGTRNYRAAENSQDPKGRPYIATAREYRPDHLAILIDKPGACSVKDGCGVNNDREPTRLDNWCNQHGGDTCKVRTKLAQKVKKGKAPAPTDAKGKLVKDVKTGETHSGQGFFGAAKSKPATAPVKSSGPSEEHGMVTSHFKKANADPHALWSEKDMKAALGGGAASTGRLAKMIKGGEVEAVPSKEGPTGYRLKKTNNALNALVKKVKARAVKPAPAGSVQAAKMEERQRDVLDRRNPSTGKFATNSRLVTLAARVRAMNCGGKGGKPGPCPKATAGSLKAKAQEWMTGIQGGGKAPTSEEMAAHIEASLKGVSAHDVARELGFAQKFPSVTKAKQAIHKTVAGRISTYMRAGA